MAIQTPQNEQLIQEQHRNQEAFINSKADELKKNNNAATFNASIDHAKEKNDEILAQEYFKKLNQEEEAKALEQKLKQHYEQQKKLRAEIIREIKQDTWLLNNIDQQLEKEFQEWLKDLKAFCSRDGRSSDVKECFFEFTEKLGIHQEQSQALLNNAEEEINKAVEEFKTNEPTAPTPKPAPSYETKTEQEEQLELETQAQETKNQQSEKELLLAKKVEASYAKLITDVLLTARKNSIANADPQRRFYTDSISANKVTEVIKEEFRPLIFSILRQAVANPSQNNEQTISLSKR